MYDVITIGTATQDTFLRSRFFKVLRDEEHLKKIGFPVGEAQCFSLGSKVEVLKPVLTTGGGAANAAVTFARQGFKTAALFKVGNDRSGEGIIEDLKKEKIHCTALKDKAYGTAHSTILLSPNGERTILVYRGASEYLEVNELPNKDLKAKWAYISSGKIKLSVMNKIISELHKNGVMIAMNPSKSYLEIGAKKLKPILDKLAVVIVNREEAGYLTGISYKNEKAIFKRFDKLVPGIAVMTDGANGISVSDGRNIYKAGIYKETKLIDRTGSGDAFGSGFVAGLIQKKENCEKGLCKIPNIEYAIRLGSANATSVVEEIGAEPGILTKHDFLSKRWKNLLVRVISLK